MKTIINLLIISTAMVFSAQASEPWEKVSEAFERAMREPPLAEVVVPEEGESKPAQPRTIRSVETTEAKEAS